MGRATYKPVGTPLSVSAFNHKRALVLQWIIAHKFTEVLDKQQHKTGPPALEARVVMARNTVNGKMLPSAWFS